MIRRWIPKYQLYLLLSGVLALAGMTECTSKEGDGKMNLPGMTGTVINHPNISSKYVIPRNVDVWLPESYDKNPEKKYAVIYMHDGQNLYDPQKSFIGVDWGMDETMTRLIQEQRILEAIVVGIWNTEKRYDEYMPQKAVEQYCSEEQIAAFKKDRNYTQSVSDSYLKFMVHELKPLIDSTYRTLPGRENTFIMGSSMGGLISIYALCEYPDIFGGAGCLSTHWPAGEGCVIGYLKENLPFPENHKIYFDYGTKTLDAEYEPFQLKVDQLLKQAGFKFGRNWLTRKFEGDDHSERAWRKRVHVPIEFFLGDADS